jgi:hypothetical protein
MLSKNILRGWFEFLKGLAQNSKWVERRRKKYKIIIDVKSEVHLDSMPPHHKERVKTFQMLIGNDSVW